MKYVKLIRVVCGLLKKDMSLSKVKIKNKKPLWNELRHPVPQKVGGPLTTKKGEKGYNRKRMKKGLQEELKEFESEDV